MADQTRIYVARDEFGNVLCCHGRPMSCLECGEEYATEIGVYYDAVARGPANRAAPTTRDKCSDCIDLEARLRSLEHERDEARQALENDAADLWRVVGQLSDVITARSWVTESRGSYAWDDDRYRDECRLAFNEVRRIIADVQPPAQRRFFTVAGHEPAPMQKLRDKNAALEQAYTALREQVRAKLHDAGGQPILGIHGHARNCGWCRALLWVLDQVSEKTPRMETKR